MAVAKLQVRAAHGKHRGIGEQDAGGVEVLATVVAAVVVHVGSKHRCRAASVHLSVLTHHALHVPVALLAAPQLGVAELHVASGDNLRRAVVRHGVHHKQLVGACLLHRVDEVGVGPGQGYLAAGTVGNGAAIAQLVDVVAVEVESLVDIVVLLNEIVLPRLVRRVAKVDGTTPSVGQRMVVLLAILEHSPVPAHSAVAITGVGTEEQVVEHGLHAVAVVLADVVAHHVGPDLAVGKVGPLVTMAVLVVGYLVQILPVVVLYAVDVATVQPRGLGLDGALGLGVVVGGHEAIARKLAPRRRHVDGNGAVDGFLVVAARHIDHGQIAGEVALRSSPAPLCARQALLAYHLGTSVVTHTCSRGQRAVVVESHLLAGSIQTFVGRKPERISIVVQVSCPAHGRRAEHTDEGNQKCPKSFA